jgi:hypothetical protein
MNGLSKVVYPSLAIFVVAFYGLNIDTILGQKRWSPYVYQYLLASAILIALPLFSIASRKVLAGHLISHSLSKWLLFLVMLSMAATLFSHEAEYLTMGWKYIVSTLAIVLTTVQVMLNVRYSKRREERAYLYSIVYLIAVFSVVTDTILDYRAIFDVSLENEYEASRSGGLFFQPNIAAVAISFLLAMVLPRINRNTALLFSLFAFIAISLTFSRSGLLVLFIILFYAVRSGHLPALSIGGMIAIVSVLVTIFGGLQVYADIFNIGSGSGHDRLFNRDQFINFGTLVEDYRLMLAVKALEDFIQSPLFGYGLGYSWFWADSEVSGQGTHNLMLRNMLDYGMVGAFIWVLFLFALYKSRAPGISSRWAFGICLAGFVSAFFSHNITEQGSVLVPLITSVMLAVPKSKMP